MQDVNSLLSTLSQSAAAMVAIIGGFLVSRLVALSSEREGIARQLKAAKQRLTLHRAEYEPAHEYRLKNSISTMEGWLLDELTGDWDRLKDKATAELVEVPRGSSLEEMLPYAEKFRKRFEAALTKVVHVVTEDDNDDLTFGELAKRGLMFAEEDQDLAERAASLVISMLPSSSPFGSIGLNANQLASIRPAGSHEIEMRRLDESIRDESDLHSLVVADEHEVERLGRELDAFAQPVGVTSAVWILTAFSIVGIMAPLLVMAFWPRPVPDCLMIALIVGFGAGLAAVLGYVAWYQREISRQSVLDVPTDENAEAPDASSTNDAA